MEIFTSINGNVKYNESIKFSTKDLVSHIFKRAHSIKIDDPYINVVTGIIFEDQIEKMDKLGYRIKMILPCDCRLLEPKRHLISYYWLKKGVEI